MAEIDTLLKESELFIEEVIKRKYCHENEKSWEDIVKRFEKGLKEDKHIWEGYNLNKMPELLRQKKFIPAGSVLYGYKNKSEKVSLSNCYFIPIEQDSMEGIYEFMKQQAKTYSWRGGVGTDISILRPKGAKVNNAAKTSSGAVSFMPLLSENTNTIGQNGRRGAHIITIEDWHPDLPLFIRCKTHPEEVFDTDFINNYTPNVYYANISVKLTDKFLKAVEKNEDWELIYPDIEADKEFYNKNWHGDIKHWLHIGGKIKVYETVKAKDILKSIAESMWKGAEPGVLYWDTVLKESQQNLIGTEYEPKGVNPCVTGDTLVAVADGRNAVPIKQLAEESKDVPVFAVDENNNIVVKMMRHPRITGYNEDIYKVKFDDGSVVKVTANHEFRMKDGSYKKAKDLKSGDSLAIYMRFKSNFEEVILNKESQEKLDYWTWSNGLQTIFEHHIIKERLQVPEYKQFWLKQIKEANSSLEHREEVSKARLKLMLEKAKQQTDLPVFIYNGSVCVKKKCEICGKEFIVPFYSRERAYCSLECSAKGEARKKAIEKRKLKFQNIKQQRQEDLFKLFAKFIKENQKIPLAKEFKNYLKQHFNHNAFDFYGYKNYTQILADISKRFHVKCNVTKNEERVDFAKKLIENGMIYNHKVVSVKYLGKDTVYNGTVDDVHNFMIKIKENQDERNTQYYVNTLQCGEQILSPYSNCNLQAIVLYKFVENPFTEKAKLNYDDLKKALQVALEFGDYVVDINHHPLEKQNYVDRQLRKVGIEFTGLADMLAMLGLKYDSEEALEFLDNLFAWVNEILLEHNIEMAKLKGCCPVLQKENDRKSFLETPIVQRILEHIAERNPEKANQMKQDILTHGVRNIAWLNNGPTGSVSIIADNCSSGIEPLFKLSYIRRSRLLNKETNVLHLPLMKWLIENKPEDLNLPESELKKKYYYREAHEIDFKYRVKLQGILQKWITDSISSTINLPQNTTPEQIFDLILLGWKNGLKGLTIFRDGSIKGVLDDKQSNKKSSTQVIQKTPIPPERISYTYTMYWKKVKVYVTIPVVDNYPVEVFAKLPWEAYLDAKGNKSIQLKLEREANWNALSRMVSLALRYKIPMNEITKALDKSSEVLGDLPNIISRALKKTIEKIEKSTDTKTQVEYETCPECGKKQVIKEGGCKRCLACGWSKCE